MNEILDDNLNNKRFIRRRELLPKWIKVFCWIFMIMGALAPVVFMLGALFGMNVEVAFYGLETNEPISVVGIILAALLILKGIAAFGLWTEKDWAVNVALFDAIVGILFCVYMMLIYPFSADTDSSIKFRLELLLLIPYLIKLYKIRRDW